MKETAITVGGGAVESEATPVKTAESGESGEGGPVAWATRAAGGEGGKTAEGETVLEDWGKGAVAGMAPAMQAATTGRVGLEAAAMVRVDLEKAEAVETATAVVVAVETATAVVVEVATATASLEVATRVGAKGTGMIRVSSCGGSGGFFALQTHSVASTVCNCQFPKRNDQTCTQWVVQREG